MKQAVAAFWPNQTQKDDKLKKNVAVELFDNALQYSTALHLNLLFVASDKIPRPPDGPACSAH